MAVGSLDTHLMVQHRKAKADRWSPPPPPPPPVFASFQLHLFALDLPCCTIRCVSRDPATIHFLQSPHSTRSLFLSRYVDPSPVILRPYATSDRFPAAGHGLQVILTVLPTFACSPTRSNNPTRVLKAHCSQRGSDDATMPSFA